VVARSFDDRAIAGFEHIGAIGNLSLLLDVEKVERQNVDAADRQPRREVHDEATGLAGAGAMREHQRRGEMTGAIGGIDESCRLAVANDD
jgi:hypothetical protein